MCSRTCTKKTVSISNCKCYDCALLTAIKHYKIGNNFSFELVNCIIDYIPRYAMYGIFGSQQKYQEIPQLSHILHYAQHIYRDQHILLIHTKDETLFLFDTNNLNSLPIPIQPDTLHNSMGANTKWIVESFSLFHEPFDAKESVINHPAIFYVINPLSLDMFTITIHKPCRISVDKVDHIKHILESFRLDTRDKLKVIMLIDAKVHGFWFLFESERSINVPYRLFRFPQLIRFTNYDIDIESSEYFDTPFPVNEALNGVFNGSEYHMWYDIGGCLGHQFKFFARDGSVVYRVDISSFCRIFGTISLDFGALDHRKYDVVDMDVGEDFIIFLDANGNVYDNQICWEQTKTSRTVRKICPVELGIKHVIVRVVCLENNKTFFITCDD